MNTLLALALLAVELPRPQPSADGFLVDGALLKPFGVNYIRLRTVDDQPWHDTFNPASYDPDRAERMFADLAARGMNVVRVFIDPLVGGGIVESAQAGGLSRGYLAALCDFLARGRAHRVYTILAFSWTPDIPRYRALLGEPIDGIGGTNQMHLHPGHLAARALFMQDVAAAVRLEDPGLLSAILAWEAENESCFLATEPPFSLREGAVTCANGVTYDLSEPGAHQRLADEGAVHRLTTLRAAVRAIDPAALLGVNVFTFAAVGRSGPDRLGQDETPDARFPYCPLALVEAVDYVDIHLYPRSEADSITRLDLPSIEWDALPAACRRAGRPLFVGETGMLRPWHPTPAPALERLRAHMQELQQLGFGGWLYWSYDSNQQDQILWNGDVMEWGFLDAFGAVRP